MCTAVTIAIMLSVVLIAPAVRMVRRGSFCTANCTPVAVRNIANAMAPATIRLVVPSRPDSSDGPSESTNEVAVMPIANTAMPRTSCRPLPCGTPGTRIQAPLAGPVGRRTGMRGTARTAVASSAVSTTKTVTVGPGRVSDSTPARSGPRPAPKTMAQEASGWFGFDRPKCSLTHHFKALREVGVTRQRQYGLERRSHGRVDDVEARFPGLLELVAAWTPDGQYGPLGAEAHGRGPRQPGRPPDRRTTYDSPEA